jgi:quercetin dioxygenase-like cupin family protein
VAIIHRYKGPFDWQGVRLSRYPPGKESKGVSVRWLIGPNERAPNFALRYFEVEPGGWTSLDQHAHDHGVVILRGRGQVRLGQEEHLVSCGDVVYIPGNEIHQIRNPGEEPLGFLCVIPPADENRRADGNRPQEDSE